MNFGAGLEVSELWTKEAGPREANREEPSARVEIGDAERNSPSDEAFSMPTTGREGTLKVAMLVMGNSVLARRIGCFGAGLGVVVAAATSELAGLVGVGVAALF